MEDGKSIASLRLFDYFAIFSLYASAGKYVIPSFAHLIKLALCVIFSFKYTPAL